MNYHKAVIEIIGYINNTALPVKLETDGNISGVNKFKTIANKFDIDGVKVYIKSFHGRKLLTDLMKGDKENFKNLDYLKLPQTYNSSHKMYVFPLEYKDSYDKRNIKLLGHVVFHKEIGFQKEEFIVIRDLIPFVTEFLIKSYKNVVYNSIEYKKNQIAKFLSKDNLPGTKMSKTQVNLRLGVNAYSAFFCLLDNDSLIVDYFTLNFKGAAYTRKNHRIKISDKILSLCHKSDFYVSYSQVADEFYDIFKHYHSKEDKVDMTYLVYVFKNENNPIALWIFEYDKNQLLFNYEYKEIIVNVGEQIKDIVPFLFQRKTNKMIANPLFKGRDTKVSDDKVFILMPFTLEWSNRIYKGIIKPTIEDKLNLKAHRADDMYGNDIMEDIWNSILSSKIIIADITSRNPNVFYELGLAHTVGKEVILITQSKDDIPFDLNRYRHIIYKDNLDGYKILESGLINSINDIISKKK